MPKKSTQKPGNSYEDKIYPLPIYDTKDDIYSRDEELYIDEEGTFITAQWAQKESNLGDGLDIPGAELDDDNEEIGEEDEENNYYSLGGDNHEDLEEDRA